MGDARNAVVVPVEGKARKEVRVEDVFEPHVLAQFDPKIVEMVMRAANSGGPSPNDISIEQIRANPDKFERPWAMDTKGMERVADDEFASKDGAKIPVKVYHPDPKQFGEGPYGVHLNFHGGGFVLGNLKGEAQMCLSMRDGAGIVVIDVNYRHCPENEIGKAFEDAYSALLWVRESARRLNINPDSVSVGGNSAGANLCLVVAHLARDEGIPLKLCMATVPPTVNTLDYKYYSDSPFDSFREFSRSPILSWDRLQYFMRICLPDGKKEAIIAKWPSWWFEVLRAPNFEGLCDTYIRTAQCDVLRDEGEAYGHKMIAAGNRVTIKRYMGCPHTFPLLWIIQGFEQKKQFDRDSVDALRQAHGQHWSRVDA